MAGGGVPDPIEVFCRLGGALDVEDLVVVVDEIMNRMTGDEERIRAVVLERIAVLRRTGAVRLVRAARLARRGSRSPAETRVRLVLEAAGVPRPELDAPIHEPLTGAYRGSPDFVWRKQRVLLEYEGEHHRLDEAQFRYDIVRYDDLTAAGRRVLRATGDDLSKDGRTRLAQRVARALSA